MRKISDEFDYKNPNPGEGPFYTEFLIDIDHSLYGLENCQWNENEFTYVGKHKAKLVEKFNEKFAYYEIGMETPTIWQKFLQTKLTKILPRFDVSYRLYEDKDITLHSRGYKETEGYVSSGENNDSNTNSKEVTQRNNGTSSETITETNTSEFKDTPIGGTYNNPTSKTLDANNSETSSSKNDETTGSTTGSSANTGSYSNKWDRTRTKETHDDYVVNSINSVIDNYRNIDDEFLNEFEDMFMQIEYINFEVE